MADASSPTRRRIGHPFPTEDGARREARRYDHARRFNALPLLDVERDEETGMWWVVNPNVDAIAKPPRRPML